MDEKKNITLFESEWRVMDCLWEHSPRTITQIVKALKPVTGWAKSTITTIVGRMEAKGYIYYAEGEKARQYFPGVTRDEVALSETNSLISKVFGGSVGLMMSTLADKKRLSGEEIAELYEILRKAEGEVKNDTGDN